MASEFVIDVGDATFQKEVLESEQPVLVDFWATWCGPCKALAPVLEQMAQSYKGKLRIVKFNVENDINVPQKYGVTALPTLLFFAKGAVVQTMVGAPGKAKLEDLIKKVVA